MGVGCSNATVPPMVTGGDWCGYWLQSRNVINMNPAYCNQLLALPATQGMGSSGPSEVKLILALGAESLVFSPQTAGQNAQVAGYVGRWHTANRIGVEELF